MEAGRDTKITDTDAIEMGGEGCCCREDVSKASATESSQLQVVKITATDPVPEPELSLKSVHTEVGVRRGYAQCIRRLSVHVFQAGFRYMNIGGNFFTGMDLTSEVKARYI